MVYGKFRKKVFDLVKTIPRGQVTTYKILALKLGHQGLARAIGNVLHKNKHLLTMPCHRVVLSNGQIGGYSQGLAKKRKLLQNEGIKIEKDRILNFKGYIYRFN
jgi:methylated-DNA-[protein]-cysteine S-methyltransferase